MSSPPSRANGLPERRARRAQVALAIALSGAAWAVARQPGFSAEERADLASRFSFERRELWDGGLENPRELRGVHPSLRHVESWISSVGAGIALCDLDDDGLANDVVHVEPRGDLVLVSCAEGPSGRFAPFRLDLRSAGVDPLRQAPMGCLPADLDEDGRLDLCVYFWGRPPIAFLRRGPTLAADAFVPCELGSPTERWYTNALVRADVDCDGHPDLVVGNYFPDGARVLDEGAGGVERMQHSMSRAENGGKNRVLAWRGASKDAVSYEELAGVLDGPAAHRWTLGIAAADLDGDQRPELYFANDFGPDELLWNESGDGEVRLRSLTGARDWRTPSSKVLGRDSFKGMGVDLADLNEDGLLDIWVSNITEEYALEESQLVFLSMPRSDGAPGGVPRSAPYRDESEALGMSRTGWAWDVKFADFDDDGVVEGVQATGFVKGRTNRWPELQELATGNDELLAHASSWPRFGPGDDVSGHDPNAFFVRSASGRFVDLSSELGLDDPWVSRGVAVADIDGDGDLDFALANQWEPSCLFVNEAPGDARSLTLDLRLRLEPGETWIGSRVSAAPASRAAVGAEVRLERSARSALVALVDGGNGHSGFRSPEVHFGLGVGDADEPIVVRVRWRDPRGRAREEQLKLAPGRHVVVLGWSRSEEQS